jgi:CoA:oxalate CoA-transferase
VSAPLTGVRVVELGAYTTGPLCARYLSNLGAEIIKVEPLKGESMRTFAYKIGDVSYIFHVHNVNKRSVPIDTNTKDGKAVLFELLKTADVMIENFAYGSMLKWGLDYETVRGVNPGLIYCSLSGFGHTGPDRHLRAFDTVIQGMAGVMAMTGTADGPPTKIGISAADNMGSAAGAMAITAALHHKRRTGRGQHINISMHDIMGWLSSESWALLDTEAGPQRTGNRHAAIAPQNIFQSEDGLVAVAVETQKQLDALCTLLGHEPVDLTESKAHEAVLEARLVEWVSSRTTDESIAVLLAHSVPAGQVQGIDDVAENPFTWERDILVTLQHPESGPVKLLGSPFKSSRSPGVVDTPAPTVGQHTKQVLSEILGYSDARIDELTEKQVIAVSPS